MPKKVVGTVLESERDEIQKLFNRKRALEELIASLSKGSEIYDRVFTDYVETTAKFHNWWDSMNEKYSWESISGGNWNIDFATAEIYLQI